MYIKRRLMHKIKYNSIHVVSDFFSSALFKSRVFNFSRAGQFESLASGYLLYASEQHEYKASTT